MIGAAVDSGSNSVHLLVAEVAEAGLVHLHDESVLLGLGDEVAREGGLSAESVESVVAALRGYRDTASARGAQRVTFVGTEPLRRSANAAELADAVLAETGIPLEVLSEQTEAELTYLGVTGGRLPTEPLVVVDIGGGSTELVLATPGRPLAVHSLPSGSARLSEGIVFNDPPTANELDRLRVGAMSLVRELPPVDVRAATFVGGTATNLVRMVPFTRAGLELAHGLLTSLSEAELVERYGVNSRRARQLPAGLAIVEALFNHFGLPAADVSEASLRDGAIIAAARLGDAWLAELSGLVDPSAG